MKRYCISIKKIFCSNFAVKSFQFYRENSICFDNTDFERRLVGNLIKKLSLLTELKSFKNCIVKVIFLINNLPVSLLLTWSSRSWCLCYSVYSPPVLSSSSRSHSRLNWRSFRVTPALERRSSMKFVYKIRFVLFASASQLQNKYATLSLNRTDNPG